MLSEYQILGGPALPTTAHFLLGFLWNPPAHALSFPDFPVTADVLQSSREREFFFWLCRSHALCPRKYTHTQAESNLWERGDFLKSVLARRRAKHHYCTVGRVQILGFILTAFKSHAFPNRLIFCLNLQLPSSNTASRAPAQTLLSGFHPGPSSFYFFPTEYFKHVESKMVQQPMYNAPEN